MSWNNILPWGVLVKESNWYGALWCGAFTQDIQIFEFRDDYIY